MGSNINVVRKADRLMEPVSHDDSVEESCAFIIVSCFSFHADSPNSCKKLLESHISRKPSSIPARALRGSVMVLV